MKAIIYSLQAVLFRWNRHMNDFRNGPGWYWFRRVISLSVLYFALLIWYLSFPVSVRTGKYLSMIESFVLPFITILSGLSLVIGLIYLCGYLIERYSHLDRESLYRFGVHEAAHLALWAPAIRASGGFASPFLTNVNFSIRIEDYGASLTIHSWDSARSSMGDLSYMDILLAGHIAENLFFNDADLGSHNDMTLWEQYAKRWLSMQKYSVPYFACPMCEAEAEANLRALKVLYEDSSRRVKSILECNQELIEEAAKRFVKHRYLTNEECRGLLSRFRIPLEMPR